MGRREILEQVLSFLSGRFKEGGTEIVETTAFGDTIILDSLATLEIVMFLEEEFGLNLERADLDSLTTPGGITDLILRKQQNG